MPPPGFKLREAFPRQGFKPLKHTPRLGSKPCRGVLGYSNPCLGIKDKVN